MPDTIEDFVTKLQNDGIQAGQAAADKIRTEAEQQAQRIIQEAENQAKKILQEAETNSVKVRNRTETELKLGARDTVNRLQESLSNILTEILASQTREVLENVEFLKQLLHDIVIQYAQADAQAKGTVVLNVTEPMRHQLAEWAIEEFHKHAKTPGRTIDLQATLSGAGFEYKVADGTVEVTTESVVDALGNLVGPEIRKIITEASGNGTPS